MTMDRDFFAGLDPYAFGTRDNRFFSLDPCLNEVEYDEYVELKPCAGCGNYFDAVYKHDGENYCSECLDGVLEYEHVELELLKTA
jgi:hypothetical protein